MLGGIPVDVFFSKYTLLRYFGGTIRNINTIKSNFLEEIKEKRRMIPTTQCLEQQLNIF